MLSLLLFLLVVISLKDMNVVVLATLAFELSDYLVLTAVYSSAILELAVLCKVLSQFEVQGHCTISHSKNTHISH